MMKLVIISDSHGKHHKLNLPKGDMLIHAGDVSRSGKPKEVLDFLDWFGQQDFKYKIFIAGNHDFYFEHILEQDLLSIIPKGVIYLNDSGVVIDGINIWGSPIQPWFHNWAFNRNRGPEIKEHWDLIPLDTDLLITHGPPFGILDKTSKDELVGCEDLMSNLENRKVKLHVFGHIHESYGFYQSNRTSYINASLLTQYGKMKNDPVEFSFEISD